MQKFQTGQFIKLNKELKDSTKTLYDFGKITNINEEAKTIDVYFVEESEVDTSKLLPELKREGVTILFFHYDIHY
jgi:hypothetical protein